MTISQVLTSVLGITVIAAALFVPVLGKNVIEIIMVIAGTALGTLLAVYLLGMFVPRANLPGVLLGLAAGLTCLALVRDFNVPIWWYGAFTIVPTFIVGALASLLFPPPHESTLKGTLFKGMQAL